jgi:hypothetical protein
MSSLFTNIEYHHHSFSMVDFVEWSEPPKNGKQAGLTQI